MKTTHLSRRSLVSGATAALAAQVGASILASPLRAGSAGRRLLQALSLGGSDALAAGGLALPACTTPFAWVNLSAKSDGPSWLYRPSPAGVGIVGNPDYKPYTSSGALNQLGLANWVGTYLAKIEPTISMALVFCNKGSANNGNHDYGPEIMDMGPTGCVSYYLNKSAGSLLSLDFGVQATADTSTAIFAEGGTQLVSYSSVDDAVTALTGAVQPLQALTPNAGKVLGELNALVTSDQQFAAKLAQLGEVLQGTTAPLQSALSAAQAKPLALGPTDYLNARAVSSNNPLLLQLGVAQVLWDAGLTKAVTFTCGSSDVNGGGDFTKAGGANTNRNGTSAITSKAMVGQFLTAFFTKYPQGIVVIDGEGGRNADGGDNNSALCALVTAAKVMPTQFIGGEAYTDSTKFGQSAAVKLSNGTMGAPTTANLLATAAALAGVTYGDFATLAAVPLPTPS